MILEYTPTQLYSSPSPLPLSHSHTRCYHTVSQQDRSDSSEMLQPSVLPGTCSLKEFTRPAKTQHVALSPGHSQILSLSRGGGCPTCTTVFQLYVWTPDPFNQMKRVLGSEQCSGDETLPATKLISSAMARRLVMQAYMHSSVQFSTFVLYDHVVHLIHNSNL